jgi:crotonobetainyl-CoA:carnitine CoA-transferase CaiB-like acyl-CoA transferase
VPPLDGIRVLDLTRLLPGAYATLVLADLGADVIKIEDPRGGDGMRRTAGGLYFDRLNRDKRSITLDLRSPDAARVLDALLAQSDVIVDSFRPSTARRLGVDPPSLHARHPRVVCASITGFGYEGPRAEMAAHDINYQALAGTLTPPDLPGPLVGDIGAAMQVVIKILAALFARERTGAGAVVDAPIFEAARTWAMMPTTKDLPKAPYNLYQASDGKWLALGALESKFWTGFCERAGCAPTASADDVRAILRTKTFDEWQRVFEGADVCLTPVLPPEDPPREAAAALGADTDAVLDAAGIDAEARARLREGGVI